MMFRIYIFLYVVVAIDSAIEHDCPRGKAMNIKSKDMFNTPGYVFYYEFDNTQFDGDPYVEEAVDNIVVLNDNPTPAGSTAMYIMRRQIELSFRVMYFDFTIQDADTVTIYFEHAGGTDDFVIEGLNPTQKVRIYNQGGDTKSGTRNLPYLPSNGLIKVKEIYMVYTRKSQFIPVGFGNVYLAACTNGGVSIPDLPFVNKNGASGSGKKIPGLLAKIATWVNNYAQINSVVAASLKTIVDRIKKKTNLFKSKNRNYIFADKPSAANTFYGTTPWLIETNPQVMALDQDIRSLVNLLDEAIVTSNMAASDRAEINKLINKFLKGLETVDKKLVAIGNTYLTTPSFTTSFDDFSDYCETDSECRRPGFKCCRCKCRRWNECSYLDALERLGTCIDMKLDSAIAATKSTHNATYNIICTTIDLATGAWKMDLDELKNRLIWSGALPFPGEPLPGKPRPQSLPTLTEWLSAKHVEVLVDTSRARKEIRKARKLVLENEESTFDGAHLVAFLDRLSLAYDVVDHSVIGTTNCYMEFVAGVYLLPLPQ